ncbi:MAG: efflux RND transporter permease subunit [Candidatus Pacebacteria bacterium]|nr:efflux RND transporter permease subunit [Candidatus Paceibacterota bacterium]
MYFLKRKIFTIFLLILSVAGGLYSMLSIPLEFYPEIKVPVVLVRTVYPGASPTDIEESVTNILEDSLIGALDGVDEITSTSSEGSSVVSIQFFDDVNVNEALVDVKDKVEEVQSDLPDDALEPIVTEVSFSDEPIFTIALSSQEALTQLRRKADAIEDQLQKIPGVSSIEISGIPEREVTVLLDPNKLSQYSLNPSDVARAISRAEQTLPVGDVVINDRNYRIDFESGIDEPADLSSVIITETAPGSYIYLVDVLKTLEDGLAIYTSEARIAATGENTQQAIIFDIRKQDGADITEVTDAVSAVINDLRIESPDVNFVTIFNAGDEIRVNLSDLISSGLQTIILVLIVMGFMVGFKESLIAAIAVPLSFVLTFIGMMVLGITINFITLFSLILVIGILIDSSIVIVEGIYDYRAKGYSSFESAKLTLKEFAKPVTAGAMTTISIFVPLLLLSGVTGQFIGGIPQVVNIVLIMAVIVALVFIPLVATGIYAININEPKKLVAKREKLFRKLRTWYKRFLEKLLKNSRAKRTLIGLFVFLFFGSFALVGTGLIQSEFFPPDETDQVYVNIEFPKGTPLEITSEQTIAVEETLVGMEYMTSFTTVIGSESVFVGGGQSGANYANITINLEDKSYGLEAADIARERLADLQIDTQVLTPESGPPVGAPLQVRVIGDNWSDINIAAVNVAEYIRNFNGSRDIDSGVDTGVTDIQFNVDHEKLAEYGLSALDLSSTLRTAIFGTEATTLTLPDSGETDVIVKVALSNSALSHRENNEISLDNITGFTLQTMRGEIALGSLVEPAIIQSTSAANHRNGNRLITVTAYTETGFLPADLINQFEENRDSLELPEGIELELAGAQDENDESSAELIASLGFGILLIFGVLIWQFGSIRDTLFIISVIPLGLIGVLFGLLIGDKTLSFTALLGFIALVGIVVNDSIILVDVMNSIRKENPDKPKRDVVIEGATARLRPVIVTTITTVLGMIPLLFVSPLWEPFAFAVIIGLSFATTLTLVLIPMLYDKFSK